jgi:hypothetical protein
MISLRSMLIPCKRQGQILLSMPQIGVAQVATILAIIHDIANFEKASELKCSFELPPRKMDEGLGLSLSSPEDGPGIPM